MERRFCVFLLTPNKGGCRVNPHCSADKHIVFGIILDFFSLAQQSKLFPRRLVT